MAFFTATQRAAAAGLTVGVSLYAQMDFKSTPIYLWEGDGPQTRTLNASPQIWEGLYGSPMISVTGLKPSINGDAQTLNIGLSGVDNRIINAALEDVAAQEIEGRSINIWIGFLLLDGTYTPLDGLSSIGTWIMQKPSFDYNSTGDRSINMTAETLFVQRDRSPLGTRSDRDQQRRYNGDKIFDQMPIIKNRVVPWPRY